MLEAGTEAPDFSLPDQDGSNVTLADLRGQTVVLYFYPRADTPVNSIGLTKSPRHGGLREPASGRHDIARPET